ncbi:MAG: hypothetical protein AAFR52_18995 [Pseudomonadota bacterium]
MVEGVDAVLAAIKASEVAQALSRSRWVYAGANAAHIFSIALLVGSLVPMDGRLLGLWRSIPIATLARVLVPVAALGLAMAMTTGLMLASVRPERYLAIGFMQAKLALVATGAALALLLHARAGLWLDRVRPGQARLHGALSLACWLGALVCGRFIAYAH